MPRWTKFQLGGTLLSGLVLVVWKIFLELWELIRGLTLGALATVSFFTGGAVWAPVLALFGYGYKQYYSYSTTRQRYSLQLAQSLYYQNLDNNAGVLTRLLDEAEEQEVREVLLSYFFLWKHAPAQGWTAPQLDDYVEIYLESEAKLEVDFEIGDALAKLERLGLVRKVNAAAPSVHLERVVSPGAALLPATALPAQTEERYFAVPLNEAMSRLERAWAAMFQGKKA
jgi:hypothetical protein